MKGLLHIYCGDGKGKTTAALGLALRASGNGYDVILAQFLKAQPTGELKILNTMKNVYIVRGKAAKKFSWQMTNEEKNIVIEDNNSIFMEAIERIDASKKTLLILDEIFGAISTNLINTGIVMDYLKNRTGETEIVLTGREPKPELLDMADYISEIRKIRHPYDKGIKARKGIEI